MSSDLASPPSEPSLVNMPPSNYEPKAPFRFAALDPAAVLDGRLGADAVVAELTDNKTQSAVLAEAARYTSSFALRGVDGAGSDSEDDDDEQACCPCADKNKGRTSLSAGLGVHEVVWEGTTFAVIRQAIGAPVGTNCGAQTQESVLVMTGAADGVSRIQEWIGALLAAQEKTKEKTFTIFHWHQRYHYWARDKVVAARPMESVVLPAADKAAVADDVAEFLHKDTARWYKEHGIPYKRAYLFFGPPGAGKTSLIQALAGRYSRNVCYVQPAHKEMSDDVLMKALQHAPKRSILVLEDVDALFDEKRAKRSDASSLTFTGLLNSLDGIGNAAGQIFILTTNHRERLDAALIRNGRVDSHVRFADATDEQLAQVWRQFKGGETGGEALAEPFARAVRSALDGAGISMAAVLNFFVRTRKDNAATSLERVAGIIAEDRDSRAEKADKGKKKSGGGDADKKKKGKKQPEGGQAAPAPAAAFAAPGANITLNLNLPAAPAPAPAPAPGPADEADEEDAGSGSEEEE